MGHNRRWRVLSDAERYKADYALRCRNCGREVIIERATFREIVSLWGLGGDVEAIARRLRCEACRHRGNILELAAPGLPDCLRLRDGERLPPKGVSITGWLKMTDRDRRRYLHQLRN